MNLVERIGSGVEKKIAILGLHRGAGKVTALSHLVRGLHDARIGVGIVAAGRDDEEVDNSQPPRQVRIPVRPGTIVATTESAGARGNAGLETIESTGIETSHGPILVMRVTSEGEVEPVGPGAASDLRVVVDAVSRHTQQGRTLVEGSFNRRSFAAPGIADGLIVSVGAVMAPEIERIVAGTRYYIELFSLKAAEDNVAEFLPVAEREGAAIMLDEANTVVGGIPWRTNGNADLLFAQKNLAFKRLVVPRSVGDEFVIPLLRERTRFEIVVRDPMRIALSPVYNSAWQKLGGGITVVHRCKVVALSLNPTNPAGPDKDPQVLLQAFREGISEVPSHDVVQEEIALQPKRRWFSLGGRTTA